MSKKRTGINQKALDELKDWLPKIKKHKTNDSKKKELRTLDQWVEEFDDKAWMKLAQQNKILWQIVKTTKESSDMSWKVAVNAGFITLSAATKRDIYIATLQEPTLRLNLWCITLGYSGISRKTTTRRSIDNHLNPIDYLKYIPVKMTPEALYEELKKAPNALILGDELGSFFKSLRKEYMIEMTDILSDIYDCKDILERSTKGSGRITVRNPFLRIYGGGTISVIKNFTDEHFEQGFLPRFHFVLDFDLEQREFKRIGKYNPHLFKEYKTTSKNLSRIGSLKVETLLYEDIPQEFEDFEDYCKDRLYAHTRRGDHITAPYYARLPFHALKLAGLLYVANEASKKKQTTHKVNILPADYIILGILFSRLYEQEYLQLVYRYKSSAPSGRIDTQEKMINRIENMLKLSGGITSRTQLSRDSGLIDTRFDPIYSTLKNNFVLQERKITKSYLVELKIMKDIKEVYPFMGRAPLLVWHCETFKNDVVKAVKYWIKANGKK